jgi:TetR/AcrR family transcriptional repressor of bet genes
MRRVLAERGYAGASVQAMAKAAGVTPGLVHYHFKSKEEVLLALVEEMMVHVEARYHARVVTEGSRLFAWIDALVEDDDPEAAERVRCWVAVGAEAVIRPEVRAVYAAAIRKLTDALEAELMTRASRPHQAREGAVALISAVEGYFHIAAACPDVIPPGSARDSIRAMADGLIASWMRMEP